MLVLICAVSAQAQNTFFDWLGEIQNPVPAPYVTAPNLTEASAASIDAYFAANPSVTRAVKVRAGVVLGPNAVALYNKYNIKYTFADYEGAGALAQVQSLVALIAPTTTGASVSAGNSFIGNYQFAPIASDPTRPQPAGPTVSGNGSGNDGTKGPNPAFTTTEFRNSGLNMANEQLYPGDSSFRNPINGNSTAPNIRSALFTLPIQRLSIVTQNIGSGQPDIPYISRFNNFTNPAFQTVATTIPNLPSQGGGFIQGFDTTAAAPLANQHQLLSRNDFQALVLHYKMRGASSYQLLDPGVVNYTQAQEEFDAQQGWASNTVGSGAALVNSVLNGPNGRVAALPNTINTDGTVKTNEAAGVVYSVVTNDNVATPGLAILISNLDGNGHTVIFNTRINGASLSYNAGLLAAGSHTVILFTKSGGTWGSPSVNPVFNDGALASRDGVGIPEPVSMSMLGLGAMGVLARRRRQKA